MSPPIPAQDGRAQRPAPPTHSSWHEARFLDALELEGLLPPSGPLYSAESWEDTPFSSLVEHVRRGRIAAAIARRVGQWPLAGALARALCDLGLAGRLLVRSRKPGSVALVLQERAVLWFALLRSLFGTRGKIVLFAYYLHPSSGIRKKLLRRAFRSADVCAMLSREMGERYSRELELPAEHFVMIPYKSNHSLLPSEAPLFLGDYVFSGGNSERDYRTLFQAVEGLEIPVLVSTTDPAWTRGGQIPRNVVLIQAQEPHYRRLMAAARLVVVPLTANRLRGAGEASFLNAMWHGRPVICADDVSAPEYIENGVDGIVVPPADPSVLRDAILMVWGDREKAEALGRAGRAKVESGHTHDLYCERMVKLGCILSREGEFRCPRARAEAEPEHRPR